MMQPRLARRRSRMAGFSRLEFLVRTLMVGMLAAILLERLLYYQEQVEKTVMETTIAHIRSGMRWQVADLLIRERYDEIGAMLEQNPVRWVSPAPAHYAGAFDPATQADIPKGSWYFDTRARELVYVPQLARFFEDAEGFREVRFRVTAKIPGGQQADGRVIRTEGIDIVPVHPYKWFS